MYKIKDLLMAIGLLSISGLLSTYSLESSIPIAIYIFPGIAFGALTGLWFRRLYNASGLKIFAWILLSTGASFVAVITTIASNDDYGRVSFVLGGVIGATILAISSRIFINFNLFQFLTVVLFGGIFGFVFGGLLDDGIYLFPYLFGHSLNLVYVLWQVPVGLALLAWPKKEFNSYTAI